VDENFKLYFRSNYVGPNLETKRLAPFSNESATSACEGYDRGVCPAPPVCEEMYRYTFLDFSGAIGGLELTMKQVLEQMNLDSSPGYPFVFLGQNKKEVLSKDGMEEYLEAEYEALGNEEDPCVPFVFSASHKFDMRPLEKLAKRPPSTRIFTGAPKS